MKNKKLLKIFSVALLGFTTVSAFSESIIPRYVPGGSLSPVSVYSAFDPMGQLNQSAWWYFVGLLNDQSNDAHSLQLQIISANIGNTLYGIGALGFSFKDSLGNDDYLWNFYPNLDMVLHYAIAPLQYNAATNNNFSISFQSSKNPSNAFSYQYAHDPADTKHVIGEIGAHYLLNATGYGQVGMSKNNAQLVQYQIQLSVEDQRGMVPEGINGFVGHKETSLSGGLNSWEFASPNLKVLSWNIKIQPSGTVTKQSPVQTTLTYQSNSKTSNRVWFDRQMLDKTPPTTQSKNYSALIDKLVQEKQYHYVGATGGSKPLYHGTWMAFCFDAKAFKGTCGAIAAFWQPNTPTAQMNSDVNASGGFFNLFTPDSNGLGDPVTVGSTVTEMLTMKGKKYLPFTVKNDPKATFQSPISNNVYEKIVYVTLKKDTQLAALLSVMEGHKEAQEYNIKFEAISHHTENVMGSNQFFEGAANMYLCKPNYHDCEHVGTAFLEQMGYTS